MGCNCKNDNLDNLESSVNEKGSIVIVLLNFILFLLITPIVSLIILLTTTYMIFNMTVLKNNKFNMIDALLKIGKNMYKYSEDKVHDDLDEEDYDLNEEDYELTDVDLINTPKK